MRVTYRQRKNGDWDVIIKMTKNQLDTINAALDSVCDLVAQTESRTYADVPKLQKSLDSAVSKALTLDERGRAMKWGLK